MCHILHAVWFRWWDDWSYYSVHYRHLPNDMKPSVKIQLWLISRWKALMSLTDELTIDTFTRHHNYLWRHFPINFINYRVTIYLYLWLSNLFSSQYFRDARISKGTVTSNYSIVNVYCCDIVNIVNIINIIITCRWLADNLGELIHCER